MSENEKLIRLIRPSVVVLCGPAGCGKTTFARRVFRRTQIVSSDEARALVCDDERDQRFNVQAFALLHCLIDQRLSINRLCIVDSTALTEASRRSLLELAHKYKVPSVLLLLDVPLETCIQRDEARERSIGRAAIERQYELFQQARVQVRQEGFDEIVELNQADLDSARVEIVFRPAPRISATMPPQASARSSAPGDGRQTAARSTWDKSRQRTREGTGPQPAPEPVGATAGAPQPHFRGRGLVPPRPTEPRPRPPQPARAQGPMPRPPKPTDEPPPGPTLGTTPAEPPPAEHPPEPKQGAPKPPTGTS